MYQAFTRVPFYIPRFWFSNSTICTIALSNTQRLNERHFYVSMNRFNIGELFVENCGLSDDLWKLLNQNFSLQISSFFANRKWSYKIYYNWSVLPNSKFNLLLLNLFYIYIELIYNDASSLRLQLKHPRNFDKAVFAFTLFLHINYPRSFNLSSRGKFAQERDPDSPQETEDLCKC